MIIGVVIAAAFVLLLLTFRSPVLALKAAILNLLSIGAAYGVIVAVFQWGWGGSLLGVSETVPIESYVPMMMFAIVFGLSMDYEVFLLSRVREGWLARRDNHASVAARPGRHRPGDQLRGADHGQRLPGLPAVHQRGGEDARPRPGRQRAHRRHHHPAGDRPRHHVPARPVQLVGPVLAGPLAARLEPEPPAGHPAGPAAAPAVPHGG